MILSRISSALSTHALHVSRSSNSRRYFYGNIVVASDGREINVDSRPSDAIAIAVRAHVPIFVHASVMETAGMLPDQDMPETSAPSKREAPAPLSDEASDRLTVFKDFIEKLDIDNPDKDKPDSPPT
jgi:bifunctional DNase/RNase